MEGVHNEGAAIFNRIPVNETVDKIHWVEVPATRNDDNTDCIVFNISGDGHEYTCLRESYFLANIAIDKTKLPKHSMRGGGRKRRAAEMDGDIDPAALARAKEELLAEAEAQEEEEDERLEELEQERTAVPIDALFNSMWSRVDIKMNQTLVSTSSTYFLYKSYIETLLNHSRATKKEQLRSAIGFTGNEYNGDRDEECKVYGDGRGNSGLKERHEDFPEGEDIYFRGYLASDIMGIIGCIPYGVNITIEMYHNTDKVRLLTYPNDVSAKLRLKDITFQVCKKRMDSNVMEAHSAIMEEGMLATFPFRKSQVAVWDVKEGSRYKTIPRPFEEKIPSRLIVGMVSTAAYMGHFQKDPLHFKHYDISEATFQIDNVSVPKRPYKMNPSKRAYIEPLLDLYNVLGKAGEDADIGINRDNYGKGNFLLPFDVTPTTSADMSYIAKAKGGTSSLKLEFAKGLPEDMSVICYGVFPAEIKIDHCRTVTVLDL